MKNTAIDHLSTSTPASNISRADFERDDQGASTELEATSLADILKNSPAAALLGLKGEEGSLPDDESVPTPEESESEDNVPGEDSDNADNDSSEDEDQDSETEDENSEDDSDEDSTQDEDLPKEEDIDWEYKIPVTVDGKTTYVSLEAIRKGYATDQHLSQKGRELGELKKQIEEEKATKLKELVEIGTVFHNELTSAETELATKYTAIKEQYDKAKAEGDTFTARELKEQLEDIQEGYWKARNKREEAIKKVAKELQETQLKEQQKLLENFNTEIKQVLPEFDEKVAESVRKFALSRGIPEALLEQVYSAQVVKFINDFRLLSESLERGAAKRKKVVTTKSIPSKKATPASVREKNVVAQSKAKVLSGQGSRDDEMAFLKSVSKVINKL